jgi:hypothetical protein
MTANPFNVPLARELTTFDAQNGLEQALKWRLNEACNEIERLEEQFDSALDLLARVQPELAPNWVEANELRKKFGLGGAPQILEDIATFLESSPAISPEASASTKSGRSSDASDDPSSWASAGGGEGKSAEDSRGSRSGTPPSAS